ncbi:calmodulin-binding protein kinase [Colletotrichum tofieldiae]|nr:calmodulin-binding protein kinase [Colletotrichum tofieldiae]
MLPFLRVTTDDEPRDARIGFVFGSDPAVCDILLDKDAARGISKKQFAIHVTQEHGVLLIINRSRNKTNVETRSLGKLALSSRRALQENESVRVSLGLYDIEIRLPNHSAHWGEYRKHLHDFTTKISSQVPVFENLELESGPSASTASWTVSPYQLQHHVGSGAYGVVYRAVHRVTGDVVAIKQLGKQEHMRFEEAMLLRSITHDHIVKFHAFIIESDSFLFVMEYVDGLNLEQSFEAHHPQPAELREAIRQQLAAVMFIHHQGIVHRDIKPPNVMVKSRDPMDTKLTDFGLAITIAELADKAPLCGTPLYAAPELLEGKLYNEKVDIWSLGILFLRYSHRLPPLPKRDSKHKGQADWRPWRNWPDKVQRHLRFMPPSPAFRFTSALLTPNPSVRPSANDALAHPFFSAELSVSFPAGKTSARLSGNDLEAEATMRAPSYWHKPRSSTWNQIDNLPPTDIPRNGTVTLNLGTDSSSPERHAKRRRNSRDPSLSEIARFLEGLDDPLESFLRQPNLRMIESGEEKPEQEERFEWEAVGDAQQASDLPSLGWNNDEMRVAHSIARLEPPDLQSSVIGGLQQPCITAEAPPNFELDLKLACPAGYKVMIYAEQMIGYCPSENTVNIRSLVRLANISRTRLGSWLKRNSNMKRTKIAGVYYIQGTYIQLEDARMCCKYFEVTQEAMEALEIITLDIAVSSLP